MKKARFTEEQIAFALRQAESGAAVAEVIPKIGISEQTLYRWKKQYAGIGVAEVRAPARVLRSLRRTPQVPIVLASSLRRRMRGPTRARAVAPRRSARASCRQGKLASPLLAVATI